MTIRLPGSDLRVGDTIAVWWAPKRDTIVCLRPYTGPLTCFPKGAQIAGFAVGPGMTIDNSEYFDVIARGAAP